MGILNLDSRDATGQSSQSARDVQGDSLKRPAARSGIGSVLDVLGPLAIQLAAFFGLQTYVNSDGGALRIQFGAGMFLRLLIPSLGIYFVIVKPILRALVPRWWGRA